MLQRNNFEMMALLFILFLFQYSLQKFKNTSSKLFVIVAVEFERGM